MLPLQDWLYPVAHFWTFWFDKHYVRWAGAGGWCWSRVREKYCWLAGGWRLVLERCERKTLLSWRLVELPNTVKYVQQRKSFFGLKSFGFFFCLSPFFT